MEYTATALISGAIQAEATIGDGIAAEATINTGEVFAGEACPEYTMIDGGLPNTVYAPIQGFTFISGGTP